ncbi:MAG: cyclic di-GMP phosphodiesterase [Clostridiales bacterium]|nr:cyclic di-GMP phosphodiesterase [Clostridiales bacterium]
MEYQGSTNEVENILIVDDITSNLVILTEMIKNAGYIPRPVISAKQAMEAIKIKKPHLILLDVTMPDMDGFEFCEILKNDIRTREIPVIFISAMDSKEEITKGFQLGAVDFISKPFELEEVTLRVNNHLRIYRMQKELEEYNQKLHKMVNDQIKKIREEEKHFIFSMAKISESKEDPTGKHIQSVARKSKLLAMSLQLSPRFEKEITNHFIETIEIAASLHDMGKLSVNDQILLKPGRLSVEEREEMKQHAPRGASMLSELYEINEHSEFLKMAIEIAQSHHERWDGEGYPNGLQKNEIPLPARIVAVVDVYDALTNERCYKDALSHEESADIINREAGRSFDPDIVEVFNKIQNKLRAE